MNPEPEDVVAEIRRRRDEHAKAFDYDLDRIVADLQRLEEEAGGEVVKRAPRKPGAAPAAEDR